MVTVNKGEWDTSDSLKYKHRFNKPPTAKCYCKDCIYHEKDDCCGYVRQKTPEDGFCYRAKINE